MAKSDPFKGADASKISIIDKSAAEDTATATEEEEGAASEEEEEQEDDASAKTKGEGEEEQEEEEEEEQEEETGGEGASKEGKQEEEGAEAEPAASDEHYSDEDFAADVNTFLEETTKGRLKKPADITSLITENETLRSQLANKEPEFPSEDARKLYETLRKTEGMELQSASRYMHVASLGDLSKLTPKEMQFQAYLVDHPELSFDKAYEKFSGIYNQKYSDLENDFVQQDNHDNATRGAREKLTGIQKQVEDARKDIQSQRLTPAQAKEIEKGIQSAFDKFGGISIHIDDSKNGTVQVPLEQGEMDGFLEVLNKPQLLLDEIRERSLDGSGKFDYNRYVTEMYRVFAADRIQAEMQDHLINHGRVKQIQDIKNSKKKDRTTEQQTTKPKLTYAQAFAGAVKASQGK